LPELPCSYDLGHADWAPECDYQTVDHNRDEAYEVPVRGAYEEEREYEMPRAVEQRPHDVSCPLYATVDTAVGRHGNSSSSSSSDPVYDLGSPMSEPSDTDPFYDTATGLDNGEAAYDLGTTRLAPPEALYDIRTIGTFAMYSSPADTNASMAKAGMSASPDMMVSPPRYALGNATPEDSEEPLYATATGSHQLVDYEL